MISNNMMIYALLVVGLMLTAPAVYTMASPVADAEDYLRYDDILSSSSDELVHSEIWCAVRGFQ